MAKRENNGSPMRAMYLHSIHFLKTNFTVRHGGLCGLHAYSLIVAVVLATAVSVGAQDVNTPDKGSPERRAILDALRVPVERDLRQKIVFVADHFKVQGEWTFVSGRPTTPSGDRPSLKGTAWEDSEDLFDDNFFGLLRKRNGKWRVVAYALGCTDVCYLDWWKKHRAPRSIFPYTE